MNIYIAHYKGSKAEIQATTSYAAQCEAVKQLKVTKKDFGLLSVTLAVNAAGKEIVHFAHF
jgi:hypothetical protein